MIAVGVTEYGGPEMLHVLDVPPEPLGPTDICIQVTAATVNPTDAVIRSGVRDERDSPPPPGVVPGMEAAGEVLEIGRDAETTLQVGDRVAAIVLPSGVHGAYRTDLVVPAASAIRVPAGASDFEAATLPMNGLTAVSALESLRLRRGQVLAVTGAVGAVGAYIVQLAKACGIIVVADAADADRDLVAALGADVVISRGSEFGRTVRQLFPAGVDGVADAAVLNESALAAVKDGGTLTSFRFWDGGTQNRVDVIPVSVSNHVNDWKALDHLRQRVEDGTVTLRVAATFAYTDAAEAHRRLETGGLRGRLVLDFTAHDGPMSYPPAVAASEPPADERRSFTLAAGRRRR